MDYYKLKQAIAVVDKTDKILRKIDKWQAHEQGVLHRAFTLILTYAGEVVLQHRKHPAFDKVLDMTFSSHQVYAPSSFRAKRGISLQTDLEAIYDSLLREWNIKKTGLVSAPKMLGKIYYQAKDPNSIYTEHEIDYIYEVEIKNPPRPNPDFAYGFTMIPRKNLRSNLYSLKSEYPLAPWVKKIVEEFF